MTIEESGALAEVVAAIAVLITLIYLSVQVRQANLFAKSQARQRMMEHAQAELYTQMADPSITHCIVKDDKLTEEEQASLSMFLTAFMRQRELEWFQYQDGIIDEDVYQAYHQVIAIFLSQDRTKAWWNTIGRFAFEDKFVNEVDSFLETTPPSSYLDDIRKWDDT